MEVVIEALLRRIRGVVVRIAERIDAALRTRDAAGLARRSAAPGAERNSHRLFTVGPGLLHERLDEVHHLLRGIRLSTFKDQQTQRSPRTSPRRAHGRKQLGLRRIRPRSRCTCYRR
jgi:hypothetical protein